VTDVVGLDQRVDREALHRPPDPELAADGELGLGGAAVLGHADEDHLEVAHDGGVEVLDRHRIVHVAGHLDLDAAHDVIGERVEVVPDLAGEPGHLAPAVRHRHLRPRVVPRPFEVDGQRRGRPPPSCVPRPPDPPAGRSRAPAGPVLWFRRGSPSSGRGCYEVGRRRATFRRVGRGRPFDAHREPRGRLRGRDPRAQGRQPRGARGLDRRPARRQRRRQDHGAAGHHRAARRPPGEITKGTITLDGEPIHHLDAPATVAPGIAR
jgi:hypothetical protein